MGKLCAALLSACLLGSVPAMGAPRYNITAVSVSAPTEAVAGSSITVSGTFASASTSAPPAFFWAAYLTTDGVVDRSAILLGRFGPVSLAATEQQTFAASAPIPTTATGLFTVAVVADVDNTIAEYDELDNSAFASALITIRPRLPSVSVVNVSAEEARLQSGQTLHIDFLLLNSGELAATVPVDGYISAHPAISTVDPQVGTTSLTVQPGQMIAGHIAGPVPLGIAAGDYTVGIIVDPNATVMEASTEGSYGRAPTKLNVYRTTLSLDTATLPDGALGIPYYAVLSSSGGDGHYSYTVAGGSLPAGLSIDATSGIVQGTPTVEGMSAFSVSVASATLTSSRAYSVNIHPTGSALTIVTHSVLDGALANPYQQNLIAAGGEPPYAWSVKDGDLPPGLTLDPRGAISGVPATIGAYPFTLKVTDNTAASASADYSINIAPPVNVVVLLDEPPPIVVGSPIDFPLKATGGLPPYSWKALSTPPPGMIITDNGHIQGMATQIGRFPVRVIATDSTRVRNSDTALVQVTVQDDGRLQVTTESLPPVSVRTVWNAELDAMGGESPLTWSIVPGDHLPDGFFLFQGDGKAVSADVGIIRGTTVHPGLHAFTVRVEDAVGRRANKILIIDILKPGQTTSSSGCRCAPGRASPWIWMPLVLSFIRRRRIA
jgi:hypothetical protein